MIRKLTAVFISCCFALQAGSLEVRPVDDKSFVIEIEGSESVQQLKALIEDASGYPAAQQRLIYKGQVMGEEIDMILDGSWVDLDITHVDRTSFGRITIMSWRAQRS